MTEVGRYGTVAATVTPGPGIMIHSTYHMLPNPHNSCIKVSDVNSVVPYLSSLKNPCSTPWLYIVTIRFFDNFSLIAGFLRYVSGYL